MFDKYKILERDIRDFYLLVCRGDDLSDNTTTTKTSESAAAATTATATAAVAATTTATATATTTTATVTAAAAAKEATMVTAIGMSAIPLATTGERKVTSPEFIEYLLSTPTSSNFATLIKTYWDKKEFALKSKSTTAARSSRKTENEPKRQRKLEDFFFNVNSIEKNANVLEEKKITLEYIIKKIAHIQEELEKRAIFKGEEGKKEEKIEVIRLLRSFSSDLCESFTTAKLRKNEEDIRSRDRLLNISVYGIIWLICVWINVEKNKNTFQFASSLLKKYFSEKFLKSSVADLRENAFSETATQTFYSFSPYNIWKSVEYCNNIINNVNIGGVKVEAVILYSDKNNFFGEGFFKKMSVYLDFNNEKMFSRKYIQTGRCVALNAHFCKILKIFSHAAESILFHIAEHISRDKISNNDGNNSAGGIQQQQQQQQQYFRTHILLFGSDSKTLFYSLPKSLQQKYREHFIAVNLDVEDISISKPIINIFQKINLI